MSKDIRISDRLFARLQLISTALVDTPESVISRLIDHYERGATAKLERHNELDAPSGSAGRMPSVYLAPATDENLTETIVGSKSLDVAERHLDDAQFAALQTALVGRDRFHCWAMTASSQSKFDAMHLGDIILFTPKASGRFALRGRVIHKLDSERLGNALWPVIPGKPWQLIYFLDDIQKVNVAKSKLVKAFGYSSDYMVPGIVRVDPQRLRTAVDRYGSIDAMLANLG